MSKNKQFCSNCIDNVLSLFYVLSDEEKLILSSHHECLSYTKGEYIFREGEEPTGLLCLSSGKAKIFKDGVGTREQIMRMAKPVGFIGYRALFASDNYRSSAVAIEDCEVCVIDKDSVLKVLKGNGELSYNIISYMAKELGFSNKRTVTLTQKHIRGRLAESLLFLRDTYGTDSDGADTDVQSLKVCLSREDIANLSNMTTSNAIRTLSAFSKENIIELEGRKITILKMKDLERISELG